MNRNEESSLPGIEHLSSCPGPDNGPRSDWPMATGIATVTRFESGRSVPRPAPGKTQALSEKGQT